MKLCWIALVGLLTLMSIGDVFLIRAENRVSKKTSSEGSLDASRAKSYLDTICRIGPRVSGSRGMLQQQRMIVKHFTRFRAGVRFQSFDVAHPLTGLPVRMNNLIVSWNPQSKQRVLFACHYDTRPFPDRDQRNPRGTFLGANDGASGVALFMELAHHMQAVKSTYGVDFVFFDGEELIYPQRQGNKVTDRGEYFLGSKHFAREYRDRPPEHRYSYGILVDMIADRNLNIYQEKNSLKHARELTESIWSVAKRLKVREFHDRQKYEIRDDHLPLNEIAKIPTCDIIDFDYPAWHTTRDVPLRCSGTSMVKVGRVLLAWLKELPPLPDSGSKKELE
jgi:glutaminyl-peptide cyclotransferase